MPLLASFLSVAFGAMFSFFGRFMVMEKAARLAAWTVSFGLIAALITAAYSCISGICATNIASMASIHPSFGMGLGIAWNAVTLTAASCYMTVWIACQIYVMKKISINLLMLGN